MTSRTIEMEGCLRAQSVVRMLITPSGWISEWRSLCVVIVSLFAVHEQMFGVKQLALAPISYKANRKMIGEYTNNMSYMNPYPALRSALCSFPSATSSLQTTVRTIII